MNGKRKNFAAVWIGVGLLLPSMVLAGGRGSRRMTDPGISFRSASAKAADGFTAMTTDGGVTVFVSSRGLFSSKDIAAARIISQKTGQALELSLPAGVSDRLTSAIRARQSDKIAIVKGKKLIAVGRVDLDSGAQPRLVDLGVGGAARIARQIKRVAVPRTTATFSVVPRKTQGKPGDTFTVDVYVSDITAIMTYQLKLVVKGGTQGELKRTTGTIDQTRGDYLFSGKRVIAAVDQINGRFGGVTMEETSDARTPKYVGTYSFRASPDAAGEFNIVVSRSQDSFISGRTTPDYPYRSTGATIRVSR